MAKECEVTSKTYNEIRVIPAAARISGEMELFHETLGFYITATTLNAVGVFDSGQLSTAIIDAEIVTVTKKSGEVWVTGQAIFWLESGSEFTNVDDGSGKLVGKVKVSAATGDATGDIVLRDYYPVQRGLQLGAVTPYKIGVNDPLLQLLATTSELGSIQVVDISLIPTVANINTLVTFRASLISAIRTGSYACAIYGKVDYGALGDAAGGTAAGICAEMNVPGKVTPGGAMFALDAEIGIPVNAELSDGHIVAFMKMGVWGTAKTEMDDHGFLFYLAGVASTGGGLFDANAITLAAGTAIVFDATFKVSVNGTDYFIPAALDRSMI